MIQLARAPPNQNNTSLSALTNRSILHKKTPRHLYRSTFPPANIRPIELFNNSAPISSIALKEDFYFRKKAYLAFPPEVTDSTIREANARFQVNIKNAIKHMDYIYYSCNRFVNPTQIEMLFDNNAILMSAFETNILYYYKLDICSYCS